MRAGEKNFLRFMEGTDKNFVIPIYQRNYDWRKENCKQLFRDLKDIANDNYRSHFMGSIVNVYNQDSKNAEYLIIDGQQRLTTISILLLAIHNAIVSGDIEGHGVNTNKIREEYLIDKYAEESKKIKLKPIKNDYDAFCKLFELDEENISDSNITHNYNYFYNELLNSNVTVDRIYFAIESLVIVEVELKSGEDDPQLIFESLNSTGLALNEADKVRNFVLMKLERKIQEKYYNKYWNKIEVTTNYNVSDFLRHFLTIKLNKIPNIKDVYFTFKRYYNDNVTVLEEFLIELLEYSKIYESIKRGSFNNSKINDAVSAINQLETNVSYPFLMEVFMDCSKGVITEDQCVEVVIVVRDYVFRRIICEIPTNSLNKTFMTLNQDIKRHKNYSKDYAEICKYIFISKDSYQRFPDDREYRERFISRDIYNMKSKNKLYLLAQLENYNNKEKVDLEGLLETGDISIEHVMPQTLTDRWKEDLGPEWERIYEQHLNTIGNITLTGYNSEMQNKPFVVKRDSEKGFKESKLKLNKYIKELDSWTEENILGRAELLLNEAIKIWAYPKSSYQPEVNEEKTYTLDDEKNFSYEKIESFSFMEKIYTVNNWTGMYTKLLELLFEQDDFILDQIISGATDDANLARIFTKNSNTIRREYELREGAYVECNLSTENKLQVLRRVINVMDIDLASVSFVIR